MLYIYIYILIYIYIYEFQSYCIHTCIVHPFAEAIPNCLIYLGDVATFAVLPAFEPLGHAGYPVDIWIGFPWLCNLTPTVVGVISRLMSPTAPPSWLQGWNGWLWILHVSVSSPQGRCRTLRSLFGPHQQVKHWSSMFVMSLCDITSRTSRFELAFVQGTVIIWYDNIIIWFHLMCNIIFNTYSAIIYHHLQCPVRQSVSSARSFWLTSKMVKHWQLKQVAPCDWCSSDQGTLRGGTKIGTNFIDLENTAEFPLYDLWVHSCPFILWEFMTIHDHSWPFMTIHDHSWERSHETLAEWASPAVGQWEILRGWCYGRYGPSQNLHLHCCRKLPLMEIEGIIPSADRYMTNRCIL